MSDDTDTKTIPADGDPTPEHQAEPKPKRARTPRLRSPKTLFVSLISIAGTVVVLAIGAAGGIALDHALSSNSNLANVSGFDGNSTVANQPGSVAAVAAKVSPSVVSVLTQSQAAPSAYGAGTQEGAGTGVIVSKDGYVMTNNHVIDGASSVTVVDSTGQQYNNVTVIGRDPLNDIAFLKINSSNSFTPVTLGNSATIRVGEQVIAIGNALGQYSNTVTSGIISGTGRPVTAGSQDGQTESLTDLIQTDAAINSGNSGGPLVNMAGQVIGINTATVTGANGIGFSIPINSTKGVLEGVLQTGKISRAFLGLSYLNITPDVAKQFNLSSKNGAYVYAASGNAVTAGSPADKAGLKAGDIITKVDNYTVGADGGLSSITGLYRPGQTATITYLRGGASHTVQVTFSTYGS